MDIKRIKRNIKEVSIVTIVGVYIGTLCGFAMINNPIGYIMAIILVIFLIICIILFGND